MNRFLSRVKLVLNSSKPLKLLLAYLLRKSRLSYFFLIKKEFYTMRFYSSALLMHYWVNKNERENEIILLTKLVSSGDTVIDIGANVGTVTLPLACAVSNQGRVISIEAHPRTYRYLQGNIALNQHLNNIVSINIAIGHKIGEVYFSDISSDDMNSIVQKSVDVLKVPMTRLDTIIKEHNVLHVRLLKIDIEGYEFFALIGAKEALQICDIVVFESWEKHFKTYGYSTKDILDYLRENQFLIYKKLENSFIEVPLDYISSECENLIAFKNEVCL